MNKGFTLVELLAVLFILSVITVVAVPNVIITNKKTKENDINQFKKTVENAAEVYVETHLSLDWVKKLKTKGGNYCISIKDLIDTEGNMESANLLNPNLKNPENDTEVSKLDISVLVTKNDDGEILYEYKNSDNCA
ncbi:MAG: prepilin-type N-terminal cleavage/methylation domain-containing protein [Bacilli bacterium]|nr:prepilin-type N-terminal cleavage/methylation domain-containing protein [Bacilli bacterium]